MTHERLAPGEMFPAGDARFRTRYIEVPLESGNVRLRVVECGDPATERVAVCVHGWACSAYSFRRLMPLLADAGIRSLAPDLPGHGLSAMPSDRSVYTLRSMCDAVIGTMNALDVKRAIMVGHSMGGPICARITAEDEAKHERVAQLALLAPAGFGAEWALRMARVLTPGVPAPVLRWLVPRWTFRLVLAFAYGKRVEWTERDVDEYWAPTQFRGFVPALWDLLHTFDWSAGCRGELKAVMAPTALIGGSRDHFIMRGWLNRYAAAIAGSRLTIVDGCGHVVPEEAPEAVLAAIMALCG